MREPEKVKVYALDEENGMSWIESPTTGDVPTEKVGSACVSLGDRAIVLHGGKCLGGIQKDVHFGSLRILDVPTMTWIAPVSKRDGYEEVEPGVHLKPLPRCAHVAVLMSGKRIAFLGGKNKSGPIYDGCADVYDYLNNRWLRPIEVFGENIIVDTTCYAQTDVGTYCFMERNGDVNALDVNEMVWDPSLVRCDNLHELEDDIAGRSMTLCGDVLVVVGGAKKDLSGGSRYRVGGYNDDEMMAATWTTRLAPANAAIVGKGENAVLPRKMEANPTAAATNMQKVGVWDGGIGKAASAWNDALSEQPSSFQQTQTQQQKKHDFDRFSRNSLRVRQRLRGKSHRRNKPHRRGSSKAKKRHARRRWYFYGLSREERDDPALKRPHARLGKRKATPRKNRTHERRSDFRIKTVRRT